MLGVLAATVLAAAGGCSRAPTRPNVVLVVIDTLRADHLGCYGYARAETPRLDALAASGTRFAAARAATSWTLPSVATILTGKYPVEHGVEHLTSVLSENQVTVAETLAAAGYETAAFSANVSLVIPESGFAQGFERFDVLEATAGANPAADPVLVRDGTNRAAQAATADGVTDAALAWLHARAPSPRPYFLYLHYFDPHASYTPPVAYAERFGVHGGDPLLARGQGIVTVSFKPPAADELAKLVALYDAEIAFTDHELGRLFDGLGIGGEHARDTVVVVTADHGEEFGEHGGMLHGRTLFEEMLHVPLLIAGADVPAGRLVDAPVSLVSLAATLAEIGKATPPAGLAGPSLVPAMHGAAPAPAMIFATLAQRTSIHRAAVIDGAWKFVLTNKFAPALFDLATDPGEHASLHERQGPRVTVMAKAFGERNKAWTKARAATPPQQRTLDAARRERLRQLGYVE